jgi:hypothetical protein
MEATKRACKHLLKETEANPTTGQNPALKRMIDVLYLT